MPEMASLEEKRSGLRELFPQLGDDAPAFLDNAAGSLVPKV